MVQSIIRNEILRIMVDHQGARKAITVGKLADKISYKTHGITSPRLRQVLTKILKLGEYPIGSCNRGYFIIKSERERKAYIRNLTKRRDGLNARIEWVRNLTLNQN